jgi:hypothetical protein
MDDYFNVVIITPVLHYMMGGLEIDAESRVIGNDGKPIPVSLPLVKLLVMSMVPTDLVVCHCWDELFLGVSLVIPPLLIFSK